MYDRIENINNSFIQHGKYNNRIYLMKMDQNDYPEIIKELEKLAFQESYTKIFAKTPEWLAEGFEEERYIQEAEIPGFFKGSEKAVFLSKFLDNKRSNLSEAESEKIETILDLADEKRSPVIAINKNPEYYVCRLQHKDINKLSALYAKVFKSYPFPIFEKDYLKKTMDENIQYYGIYYKNKLIAASSAEMDIEMKNAEMTDFATDPEFAGNSLSLILLRKMEEEMMRKEMKVLYTIARSFSPGMNITFAKQDYEFSGTLINNTNIFGKIESMNVWYKIISN